MSIEDRLNTIPYLIQKFIEETCPCCNQAKYKRMIQYELKIEVSQYCGLNEDYYMRFKIYYETRDIPSGNRDRYIGVPTGIGFLTLDEALNDLMPYLKNIKEV